MGFNSSEDETPQAEACATYTRICSRITDSNCEQMSSKSARPFSALEEEVFPNITRLEILDASIGNV